MGNKKRWSNVTTPGEPNEFVYLDNPRVKLRYIGRNRFEIQVDGVALTDEYGFKRTYSELTAKKYGEEIAKELLDQTRT